MASDEDPFADKPFVPAQTETSSAALAIALAALAMVAVASFWVIGTEPAHRAKTEQAAALRHDANEAARLSAGYVAQGRAAAGEGQIR